MIDIVLPIHVIVLALTVVVMFLSDNEAFSWLRGEKEILDEVKIHKYHTFMSIGLGLIIVTGFILFWPMREFLLKRPQFYIKMVFVLVLIANSFFIGRLMPVAFTRGYKSLAFKEKIPLFVSGAASVVSWVGATIAAFFLIPE